MSARRRVSLERCFSQADFDRFARLSGDANRIHVDPAFAAQTRFGRTVAHGMLLTTVLRGLVDRLAPGGRVIEQAVMFPAPSFAAEPLRFSATLDGRTADGLEITLEVTRLEDGVATCKGRCRMTA